MGAVTGNEGQPLGDGIGGMGKAHRVAVDLHLPARKAARAGQNFEQFILTLTFKGDDAQNLSGVKVKGHIGQFRA